MWSNKPDRPAPGFAGDSAIRENEANPVKMAV
jgi:hypothetical protein